MLFVCLSFTLRRWSSVSLTWVTSQPWALTIYLTEPHIQDLAAAKVLKFLDNQILQVRLEKSVDAPRFVQPFPGLSRSLWTSWKRLLLEPAFFPTFLLSNTMHLFGSGKDEICQGRISKHLKIPKFTKPSSLQGHKHAYWSILFAKILSKLRWRRGVRDRGVGRFP